MDFNFLTINNITKICDDNLYLDEKGNLTQFQWYDFQLEFALKNLEIDLSNSLKHSITEYKLTRKEILALIKQIYGNNKISTKSGIKKDILKKYGLYKGEGIKNYYVPETLGGMGELIYDERTNTVLKPKIYEKSDDNTKSDSITDINSTVISKKPRKKFKIMRKKSKRSSDSVGSVGSSDSVGSIGSSDSVGSNTKSDTIFKSNFKPNSTRKQNALGIIKDSEDLCRKMGKFDWSRNSCYADSILLGVIYNAILNKSGPGNPVGSYIYNIIMTKRYNVDNLGDIKVCPNKTIEETVVILNTIIDNLKHIVNKIESGEIISIQSFLKGVNDICSNLFTENYYDGRTHDVKDFYSNIMFILGINTTNFNKKDTLFFEYGNVNALISEPFITNPYDRTKIRTVDGLGKSIVGHNSQVLDTSLISTVEVLSNYIYNKYSNQGITTYSKQIYSKNKKLYIYSNKLNGYILKAEYALINTKLNNISFNISDFLETKHHDLFLDDNDKVYKYHDDNIGDEIYMGERYYYTKEDWGNYDRYKKSSEMSKDVGFRVGLKVEDLLINNSSIYINFNINRSHKIYSISGTSKNINLDIKVNLVETLTLSDTVYNLDFIICWFRNHYVTIFRCNSKYYLYDDTLASKHDYISEIGNFNELVSYNHINFKLFALRNSVFVAYSR